MRRAFCNNFHPGHHCRDETLSRFEYFGGFTFIEMSGFESKSAKKYAEAGKQYQPHKSQNLHGELVMAVDMNDESSKGSTGPFKMTTKSKKNQTVSEYIIIRLPKAEFLRKPSAAMILESLCNDTAFLSSKNESKWKRFCR